jgi:multiple sugar transport system permease protein/putative aldouronate transport system permease protein
VFLIVAYPLLYIISASFSSTSAVISGRVWLWPVEPSLDGYNAVFSNRYILSGYANTILYTTSGTLVNLIVTTLAAYPLSRKDLKSRNAFMLFFAITMFFHGGLIPTYLLINRLGLLNTRWVMILPPALNVWNMIIMRTFFEHTISSELLDAAQIDGCSDFRFLGAVVLPISGAIIAVMTLFYAVFHWNAFFHAFIYLNDRALYPLQLILREILILSEIDVSEMASESIEELAARQGLQELLKYSLIIVASVPVLVMYPFVQRHFVQGVMIGSIKG